MRMLRIRVLGRVTGLIALLAILLSPGPLRANNLSIINANLLEKNSNNDFIPIEFDISWDNSWRLTTATANWDAVWLFAKYKLSGTTTWSHCTLSTTDSDHVVPGGAEIDASFSINNTGKGVFLSRSTTGSGSISFSNVRLAWKNGTDGVAEGASVDIRVFGTEMVWIPTGNFSLGDGSGATEGTFRRSSNNTPVSISNAGVVVKVENTAYDDTQLEGNGILVDGDGGIDEDGITTVSNADYPTGYSGFYGMKYEISEGQYVDFLNTLTRTQQNNRTASDVSTNAITNTFVMTNTSSEENRSRIQSPANGNGTTAAITFTTDRPDRACGYLSWGDGSAFADWAGLRPMTELEFEKICRGDQTAVLNEYAWGTANIVGDISLTLSGSEDGTETVTTGVLNGASVYGDDTHNGGDGGKGPLRVGIFATGSSTRRTAGAAYWGVLEMSGNLWERCVTLGDSTGRAFTGTHGDGALSGNGHANVTAWPGLSSGEVTGAGGSGFRGGAYDQAAQRVKVSDRSQAARSDANRATEQGFRAVRSL